MFKIALLSLLAGLSACADPMEFEHKLTGSTAKAWALCKKEFGIPALSTPKRMEHGTDYVLFVWSAKAEKHGGPIVCKTDGTGKELIEIRLSAGF